MERMRYLLGYESHRTWTTLMRMRGALSGKTTVSVEYLARHVLKRPVRSVKWSLRALARCGLIILAPEGRQLKRSWDEDASEYKFTAFVTRIVRGDFPTASSADGVCAVPLETERWARNAPKRGRPVTTGVWSSKGRTAKRKRAAELRAEALGNAALAAALDVKYVAPECGIGCPTGCETGCPLTDPDLISLSSEAHNLSPNGERSSLREGVSFSPTPRPSPPMKLAAGPPSSAPVVDPGWQTPELLDCLARPRAPLPDFERHPVALGAPHPAVPTIPTGGKLAVIVPPARPLDASAEAYRKVHLVRRAYEGAVESRRKELGLRGNCFTVRGVRINGRRRMDCPIEPDHPQFAILLAAAEALITHGIPPAAWCLFVIDQVWIGKMQKKGAPPLAAVFSPSVINRWRGWFGSDLTTHGTARCVYPEFSREFMQRHARMRTALTAMPAAATDEDIAGVVARFFPDGFATELASLQRRLDRLRDEVCERIAQGKWIDERSRIVGESWVW